MNSWFVRIHFCFFVSALSKGGFSIHTNPVIMIARCQCFTSIVCQMNENASTLLQLWRSTMRAKRRTEQEQYEIIMECRQSGLSDHQWCLEHDINPGTVYNWRSFQTSQPIFMDRLLQKILQRSQNPLQQWNFRSDRLFCGSVIRPIQSYWNRH